MTYSTIKADPLPATVQSRGPLSSGVPLVTGLGPAVMAVVTVLMARLGPRGSK